MRLGARWNTGATPHPGVPPQLHPLIAQQEAEHPGAASWTLTWLESRPRCALDDLLVVALDAAGAPVIEPTGSARRRGAAAAEPSAADPSAPGADADDDDDDWLA